MNFHLMASLAKWKKKQQQNEGISNVAVCRGVSFPLDPVNRQGTEMHNSPDIYIFLENKIFVHFSPICLEINQTSVSYTDTCTFHPSQNTASKARLKFPSLDDASHCTQQCEQNAAIKYCKINKSRIISFVFFFFLMFSALMSFLRLSAKDISSE